VLHLTIEDLTGVARLRTFAAICVAAAGLLTWMVFWMRSHARTLKGELEQKAGHALAAGDAPAYREAVSAIVRDFEGRDAHLTGVPVADTAMLMEALAAPRGLAAAPDSEMMPPPG
jgi:hypothetical protein